MKSAETRTRVVSADYPLPQTAEKMADLTTETGSIDLVPRSVMLPTVFLTMLFFLNVEMIQFNFINWLKAETCGLPFSCLSLAQLDHFYFFEKMDFISKLLIFKSIFPYLN